jgi:hypothetical protein
MDLDCGSRGATGSSVRWNLRCATTGQGNKFIEKLVWCCRFPVLRRRRKAVIQDVIDSNNLRIYSWFGRDLRPEDKEISDFRFNGSDVQVRVLIED